MASRSSNVNAHSPRKMHADVGSPSWKRHWNNLKPQHDDPASVPLREENNSEFDSPYLINRARKSRVYFAWRNEIWGIFASLGPGSDQPRFRSHVKSMGDFLPLQITVF